MARRYMFVLLLVLRRTIQSWERISFPSNSFVQLSFDHDQMSRARGASYTFLAEMMSVHDQLRCIDDPMKSVMYALVRAC